jgi:hypothetical protein
MIQFGPIGPSNVTAEFNLGRAESLPLHDQAVDLTLFSPPYCDARTYGVEGIALKPLAWIDWMLPVVAESLRVTSGAVVVVAAGKTQNRSYWPAVEGLMYRWWAEGWGEKGPGTYRQGSMYRPVYWHRFGIPGSGGDQWFRSNIEHCMAFKRPGPLPWTDSVAMGHAPVVKTAGGALSYRHADGKRSNKDKAVPKLRRPMPDKANPGNLFSTGAAGGGNIGDDEAHDNEAPYPERLAEFFIKSLCPPEGLVLDPFSGSGTTVCEAVRHGRHGIGFDLRESQIELASRRLQRRIEEGRAF